MRTWQLILLTSLAWTAPAIAETQRTIPNPNAPSVPTADGVLQGIPAESWLGADGQVTEERVNRVLQALRADPDGAKLADEALKHALDTTGGPFWKVVSPCPATMDRNTLGQAGSGVGVRIPFVREIEEAALNRADRADQESFFREHYKDQLAEARKQSAIPLSSPDVIQMFPDVSCIKTYKTPPAICLRADLSIEQATSVLHHELVHYNAMDWRNEDKIASFESKQDYELKKVLSPGDEVDAYISEWSYEIRLSGKHAVPQLVEAFFKSNGSFIPKDAAGADNRLKIARLILDGPIFVGQGYALGRFRVEYPNSLNGERSFQASFVELFNALHDNRQSNLAFYQQQVRLGRDKNAAAFLKEDQDAIPRLQAELASCQVKVNRLDQLMEKFKEWEKSIRPVTMRP